MKTDQLNNKLITEFDGWIYSKSGQTARKIAKDPGSSPYRISDLHYNSSWDWLMPVVEKIEELNYRFVIGKHRIEIFITNSYDLLIFEDVDAYTSKLEAVYHAVCEFIEWHNSNTKQS